MIINNIKLINKNNIYIIQSQILWEENDIKPIEVKFLIPSSYIPDEIALNGALLIALALPALHKGERRLKIDAQVDPEIVNSINTVLAQHSHWFGYLPNSLVIEAETGIPSPNQIPYRAASFFSGGVDSFWTLHRNRVTLPHSHPSRIRDVILAYGFDMGWETADDRDRDLFNLTVQHLERVIEAADVNLISVETNIRQVLKDSNFWAARWHGMVLVAVGYMLSGRLTDIYIPSTNDLWHLDPWGSSPLIDPNFTTSRLRLHNDGIDQTRLHKVQALTEWSTAINNIRVCTKISAVPTGFLNCGVCEKCIRTKLEILACNAFENLSTFASNEINLTDIDNINLLNIYQASEYRELIGPLRSNGNGPIADSIESAVARWDRHNAWLNEEDWKGLVKKVGRRYFGWKPGIKHNSFPVR